MQTHKNVYKSFKITQFLEELINKGKTIFYNCIASKTITTVCLDSMLLLNLNYILYRCYLLQAFKCFFIEHVRGILIKSINQKL